ncbi:MAG: sortase [Candidatus Saccharibacteria bacterium]|nr:sortase [Candidatus Saccharibacteria bacterium]
MGKNYIELSVSDGIHASRSRRGFSRLFRKKDNSFSEFTISESSRRAHALHRQKVFSLLMAFYSVFIPSFLYFGLTEVSSSATYATESAAASESLIIPALNLSAPVTVIKKQGAELISPDQIAGVYHSAQNKSFIIGHSSTIFKDLKNLKEDNEIIYNNYNYKITSIKTLAKSEISMPEILKPEDAPTIVLMTCAGTSLGGHDYSHRIIVTATKATSPFANLQNSANANPETTNAKRESAIANSESANANTKTTIAYPKTANASFSTPEPENP